MQEVRCGQCQRLLAKAVFTEIQVKCPKCKTLNHQRASAVDRNGQSPQSRAPVPVVK